MRGDVIVRSLSDDPDRFAPGARFLTDEPDPRALEVARRRPHNDGELVGFVEITDRNQAETLRGVALTVDGGDRRQLDDDEFWPDQLVGLRAIDPAGEDLGVVSGVVIGEAQDRIVVTTASGHEVDVPFVAAIVGDVDLADGVVTIDPPMDLFP